MGKGTNVVFILPLLGQAQWPNGQIDPVSTLNITWQLDKSIDEFILEQLSFLPEAIRSINIFFFSFTVPCT